MGMFDYVKVAPELLPAAARHVTEWQTKSMDCQMETWEIAADRQLLHHWTKWGWDDNGVSGLAAFGVNGAMVAEDGGVTAVNYTCELWFYGGRDPEWFEFVALFDGGKLIVMRQLAPATDAQDAESGAGDASTNEKKETQ